MRLTPPRQLMLLTALVMAFGALWLAPPVLAGDAAALVVLVGMVALGGVSVGFCCHGFLTDRIIANCRRITEQHHLSTLRLLDAAAARAGRAADDAASRD